MKKIFIILNDKPYSQLAVILEDLGMKGYQIKTSLGLRRSLGSFGSFLFFSVCSPILLIIGLVKIISVRIKKCKTLVLTALPEQLLLTPWARLIGYRVYWLQSDFLPNGFRGNIFSLIYRIWAPLTTIIATSQAISEHLVADFKIAEKRIKVIPPMISAMMSQNDMYGDLAEKETNPAKNNFFIIGFIGELGREQGVEFLIKSTEHFRDFIPQYQIILVGDGTEKKSLVWLSKMMGLEHQVRFVGNQNQVRKWHSYFDILVLPQLIGVGFSRTAAEAMADGLPVVASDVPGISEIVNNQGGILVPPRDSQSLAQAILTLYHDQKGYGQFARQAADRIKNSYSQERVIELWEEVLRS